jgi:hypothetical protein
MVELNFLEIFDKFVLCGLPLVEIENLAVSWEDHVVHGFELGFVF